MCRYIRKAATVHRTLVQRWPQLAASGDRRGSAAGVRLEARARRSGRRARGSPDELVKPFENQSRPGEPDLDGRAGKPAAWIAAHAKRLYRFDSHILTQGWCDPLESGENLGASAHVNPPAAWAASKPSIPSKSRAMDHGSRKFRPSRSTRWLSRHQSHQRTRPWRHLHAKFVRAGSAWFELFCMQWHRERIGAVRAPVHAFRGSILM